MVQCRQGAPADSQSLAHIEQQASAHPWSPSRFATLLGQESPAVVLVLEVQGEVIAFLVYSRVLDEATVLNVAVTPGSQGQGHGGRLLVAAMRQMEGEGVERCLLEVRESNVVARQLYRRHGFSTDGIRKNYYPDGDGREDALLMSCQLYRE